MKKILTLAVLGFVFALTSCTTAKEVSYLLEFDLDSSFHEELGNASKRVVERRLESMGIENPSVTLKTASGGMILTVKVPEIAAGDELTKQLTNPFTISLMSETGTGETVDLTVEGHGSFKKTGIAEGQFYWIRAEAEPLTGKGRVFIIFTEDGKAKVKALFAESAGKMLGLFVRNQLISKLLVQGNEIKDNIVISDIPTADLAGVFADDVNVGIHVKFTPLE